MSHTSSPTPPAQGSCSSLSYTGASHKHENSLTTKEPEDSPTTSPDASALGAFLDSHSMEHMVALKIRRFLDQVGAFYPENLYHLMMRKMEKPLITEVLKRTGGNQLQAAKILGINRLTLAKKIKLYNLSSPSGP